MTAVFSRKVAGVLAALLLLGGRAAYAQRGVISGRVTELLNTAPVPGARVQLGSTNRFATTSRDGRYAFTQVIAGSYQLRLSAIGYAAQSKPVEVSMDGTANVDFQLTHAVTTLEEIAVTPTGEERSRETGAPVAIFDPTQLTQNQTVSNLGDLLSGRVAGVQVLQSGGTVGTGTRIRIRGQGSFSLSNEPAYYVDGIRVEAGDNSLSVGTGGQAPSRINDIDPNDIQSIEIIKGPSAGTLYGTQAANGVVRITTKRGLAGRTQWSVFSEAGMLNDENQYPTNFFSWGHLIATPATKVQCTLAASTRVGATCAIDSLNSFNVLMNPTTSPIGPGYRGQAGLQVSGGSEQVQYYFSGDYTEELGTLRLSDAEYARLTSAYASAPDYTVFRPNQLHSVGFRSNVHASLTHTLDFTGNLGVVQSNVILPQNDNNVTGLLPSGLFGTGYATSPGIWGFFLPGDVSQIKTQQNIDRLTGSMSANWLPTTWFTGRATAGLDYTGRTDLQLQLNGQGPNFSNFRQGRASDNRFSIYHYTADVGGTARFALTPMISSKTSAGIQYLHDNFFGVLANGINLPPGGQTVTGGATRTASEQTVAAVTLGEYLEQEFGWQNRLFVTGGLRSDRNSAFGSLTRTVVYPKIQASWVTSEEPFFPRTNLVNNLRLRAAYGATGQQPGTTAALLFYGTNTSPVASAAGGAAATDQPGILLTAFGNSALKPERSAEADIGFDMGLFHDGLRFELTYYNKQTHDALVNVPLPPSNGIATAHFVNLGSVQNQGLEVGLNFVKDVSRSISLDGSFSIARNVNKLLSLGQGIPTIINGENRDTVGFPLFGFWDRPILSVVDSNKDGIIEPNEVTVGPTAVYLGSSIPKTNITLNMGISFMRGRLRLGGQLDYRADYKVYNFTERFRCAGAGFNCAGINNPNDALFDQARAIAATTASLGSTQAGYVEDGTFLKLRELSLTYQAPESWAALIRANRLQFSLTGHNLLKWTNYTGIDPEVNGNGQSDTPDDFLTAPPVRTISLRVTVGY